MMNRRGFLSGVLASVASAQVVLQASPEEVETFAGVIGRPVSLLQPTSLPEHTSHVGEMVFDGQGNAIGVVSSIQVEQEPQEYAFVGDAFQSFRTGRMYAIYTVIGHGPVRMKLGERR